MSKYAWISLLLTLGVITAGVKGTQALAQHVWFQSPAEIPTHATRIFWMGLVAGVLVAIISYRSTLAERRAEKKRVRREQSERFNRMMREGLHEGSTADGQARRQRRGKEVIPSLDEDESPTDMQGEGALGMMGDERSPEMVRPKGRTPKKSAPKPTSTTTAPTTPPKQPAAPTAPSTLTPRPEHPSDRKKNGGRKGGAKDKRGQGKPGRR